jgi:putative glycerol-1-phosphate prenyltransferase
MGKILKDILNRKSLGIKSLAVLIDPDHANLKNFEFIISRAVECKVDYFFIGGSLIVQDRIDECVNYIRQTCDIPVILFPGNTHQIHVHADALLFLSLLSGRNAEYLIGKHVESSMKLYASKLEIISTAYLLIDGQQTNTAAYISQTIPIPSNKSEIALATAMAGQMLNMSLVYLDAGSGANLPVPDRMIEKLSSYLHVPIIVGGGIRDAETVHNKIHAGADLVVVGNILEAEPQKLKSMMEVIRNYSPIQIKS